MLIPWHDGHQFNVPSFLFRSAPSQWQLARREPPSLVKRYYSVLDELCVVVTSIIATTGDVTTRSNDAAHSSADALICRSHLFIHT